VPPLFTGKPIVWYEHLNSTNEFAVNQIKKGLVGEGTVYAAYHQPGGRGQRENKWHSEQGENLTFSVIYEPTFLAATEQFYLNMAVCLALVKFLKTDLNIDANVKWPNDIYVEYDKIAGILIENMLKGQNLSYTVIGIGLNINQDLFDESLRNPTSVKMITGQRFAIEPLLESFLGYLEAEYLLLKALRFADLYERYIHNLLFYNEERVYSAYGDAFTGKIKAITPEGKLIIETSTGQKAFGFKEVEFMV
jgi:BirA family biotin operon repressor/biotin-[acetyl-CoA-carboxylase] ligase